MNVAHWPMARDDASTLAPVLPDSYFFRTAEERRCLFMYQPHVKLA
jgi:hypothetical protein